MKLSLVLVVTRVLPWIAASLLCAGAANAQVVGTAVAPDTPAVAAAPAGGCPPRLNFTFKKLQDESDQSLCQYAGKVVLVVNTASYCGFTGQYEGLEALYAKYQAQGLVILGFPSNDFSQEPGDDKTIADFCYNTYAVKFPMFSKTSVVGADANPLFKSLAEATGKKPRWNFYKYLIGRDGTIIDTYSSLTGPTDHKLIATVEKALAAP